MSFHGNREKLVDLLKHKDINITEHRLEILDYLLQEDSHPTAEEIYYGMSEQGKHISRATVYNTINVFEKKNFLRVVDIEGGVKRYDLYLENHAHFICETCGRIWDVPLPEELEQDEMFKTPEGSSIDKLEILIKGQCEDCKLGDK